MSTLKEVLIVDDEKDMRWTLSNVLEKGGYKVSEAEDGAQALTTLRMSSPDLILLDKKLPEMDGIRVLRKIREVDSAIPVIILTGYGDIRSAVEAVKSGAYDYLTKPFDNDDLVLTIGRAIEKRELSLEVKLLRQRVGRIESLQPLMGNSDQVKRVCRQVEKVAGIDFTVLIQGETGTGKDLVAQAIHNLSPRKEGPFIAVDCGAIPDTLVESELFGYEKGAFTGAHGRNQGQFELAEGGTLLLDEIGNFPHQSQTKLLRAIEERKIRRLGGRRSINVDVRILVATSILLKQHIEKGQFRSDLYHRLSEFVIKIPPLRERKEDIIFIADRFLNEVEPELNKTIKGLSRAAVKSLLSYDWPGNVRELRNVIRRAALLCDDLIEPAHLLFDEAYVVSSGSDVSVSLKDIAKKAISEVEKSAIKRVLRETKSNKSKAAKILQVDYKTLLSKIKSYEI
ncbi:MAG: sigma-54-dependent Fis family transcriptional regulator [Candidatus Latescibacteria bacterium]|nr:sigma-54-dependent Fis family transcriptional regulator [Candidatus Latescibacterota bacterium]